MAASPTCPRGHALEPNAVLCTVCWIRVEPVDPEVAAARRRRARRIWIPLFGTGAVALGVFLGGSLGNIGHTPAAPVAVAEGAVVEVDQPEPVTVSPADDPTTVTAPPASAPMTGPANQPEAVSVAPLAATVAAWTMDLCVPDGTASVDAFTRTGKDDPWQPVEASVDLDATGQCDGASVPATVMIADLPAGAAKVKAVSRDSDGAKLQKDKADA